MLTLSLACMGVISSVVLALVRLLLVITFFSESSYKFKDLKGFAKNDGIPVAIAGIVATAEACAVMSMLTGVLSQWAAVGVMLLMIGTTSMHLFRWHSPYWANKRGWEYDVLMFTFAAVIFVFGPGTFVLFG
ncbi:MAG TPA: DoxX family membrane protein [Candidatus Saccharimonadaceae bacterium]|nr:DoxX family membrane protein [Candidatus Saccharimonadaceae bacterium]